MLKAFYKHRYALGIVVPDGLTAELAELRELCVLPQVLTQGFFNCDCGTVLFGTFELEKGL